MAEQADAFSIDVFTLDDRLRLFSFATAPQRTEYLSVLRAFERARANYLVLLHARDVSANLAELGIEIEDVTPLLEQLYGWQVLDRSYDGARAATLAEYRNRHYVYQFTQAGYRAYRAVEDVLGASLDDATLSRLVFPELLEDLKALARANTEGDAEGVYRKFTRLDAALNDMADRAARFYLLLGDLARTNDTSAEAFLAHRDSLLAHMRKWRVFAFTLVAPDGTEERLTQARHSTLSGGEQSVSLHLPLFAAAHVLLSSASPDCPRLLALDEAFAGVDDRGRSELLALTAQFDLDLFMTGYDLWATYASVPACAHYDLSHSAAEHTVSALLVIWDGSEILADSPSGNLAAELGSPGTRRRPIDSSGALL